MNWEKLKNDLSYNYVDSEGKSIANIQVIGIKGRWRWTILIRKNDNRSGWCGTKSTKKEAQKAVLDYFNEE
jgi:hypothetical protein